MNERINARARPASAASAAWRASECWHTTTSWNRGCQAFTAAQHRSDTLRFLPSIHTATPAVTAGYEAAISKPSAVLGAVSVPGASTRTVPEKLLGQCQGCRGRVPKCPAQEEGQR